MTLIDGDRIVNAQLYDDEHEEFTEKKMSIIDYVNAYTDEGVTMADDVLDKIRGEIEKLNPVDYGFSYESHNGAKYMKDDVLRIIDKYRKEAEE